MGPMKSTAHLSKGCGASTRCIDILSRHDGRPIIWQTSQLLVYSFAFGNIAGHHNLACKMLHAVLFPLVWPPATLLWHSHRISVRS
uniref:Uncharacterized protein n=1 Tax=Picea glauca TaxID=3330 RepID=A0A101LYE2_PICGL|nr:hypothetical protein ABT39_MTgene5843 [Picea glauca]QHR92326.1 hypothetical protein Q903MT_gene6368 [Picea sitchensis]